MKPRFQHDCDACTFMGQHGIFDVYLCLSGGGIRRSIIARRSSRGDDYAFLWGLNNGIENGLLKHHDVYGRDQHE